MKVLDKLLKCKSTKEIENIIVSDGKELLDFFSTSNYPSLQAKKNEISNLVLIRSIAAQLDFGNPRNVAFVNHIINAATRVGDRFLFQSYYKILEKNKLEKSFLTRAASKFLLNITNVEELAQAIEEVLPLLKQSFLEESDDGKDVLGLIVDYYAACIQDFGEFNPTAVAAIRKRIIEMISSEEFHVFDTDELRHVLSLDSENHSILKERIHKYFDAYIGRSVNYSSKVEAFYIESNTNYSEGFKVTDKTFSDVQALSRKFYQEVKNDDTFYSLNRGVKVIDSDEQLLCYIFSFGSMHLAKVKTALRHLPAINAKHRLIDWGCGQALGSMIYLDELRQVGRESDCSDITLIEPSLKAIQRGALHLDGKVANLETIATDFDSLSLNSLTSSQVNVHLFSNILDVELFSLEHLIAVIESSFKGINYFVITSPLINAMRTARINEFLNHFQNKHDLEVLHSEDRPSGSWKKNWSAVIRIGKVVING